MDEDNNNNLRSDDMQDVQKSLQKGAQQAKRITGKVGNLATNKVKNIASRGKKFKGAKTLGNKPGEKVGKAAKLKGQALQKAGTAEKAAGDALKATGLGAQASGMGLKGIGASLKGAGAAISAIPYVGPAIGKVLNTAGEGISKAGDQVYKTGKKIKNTGKKRSKAGRQKIKRGQQLEKTGKDIGSAGGQAGGEIPGMPNLGKLPNPNPASLKSKAILLLFKRRFKITLIIAGIVLAVIILFLLLITESKKDEGGYSEGDSSNVPYVVSSMVLNQITIVKDSSGRYVYAFQDEDGNILTLDEALDKALTTLGENSSTSITNLGEDDETQKELLKKMIQAEIATQYPSLQNSEDLGYTAVPTATTTMVTGCDTNLDITEETNFITDLEQLKTALGSYNSNLESHASDFLEFQEQYKVNAIFVAAVTVWETGGGTTGNATNGCNNWGNIDSTTDPLAGGNYKSIQTSEGIHNWAVYPDAKTGIEAIFSLIGERGSYVAEGNKTLAQIFLVYNPGNPDEAGNVANTMAGMYSAAGISSITAGVSNGAGTSTGTKTGEKTTDKEIEEDDTLTPGIQIQRKDENGTVTTLKYTSTDNFDALITQNSDEALNYFTLKRQTTSTGSADGTTAATITKGTEITVPEGLGNEHTYMGWSKITAVSSMQYKLREQAGENYDSEGFAKINGRYVIACTTTYGKIGDYLDFYQEDGTIIKCIMGDAKNQTDAGCNKWGHKDGNCIVEFVVQTDTWYNTNHENPGTSTCHPEWNQEIVKVVNGGSYFEDPTFGEDDIESNGTSSEESSSSSSSTTSSENNSNSSTLTLVVANKKTTTTTEVVEYQYISSRAIDTTSGSSATAQKSTTTPANEESSTTDDPIYSTTSVDYQNGLKNYTLYFDFLWAILVDSNNISLVNRWAELATKDMTDGNKVTITVYSKEEQYSNVQQDSGYITLNNFNESNNVYTTDTYQTTTTTTVTTDIINSKPVVTYADTWLLNYENNADTYDTYISKSEEKITEKIDEDSDEENVITLLQESDTILLSLYNDKYLVDEMLEDNEKVSFMIDVYQYILDLAKGKENEDESLSDVLNVSSFNLTTFKSVNSSNSTATLGEFNGTFLEIARQCHAYMREQKFVYVNGNSIPVTESSPKHTDCSAFVTWALYEYGYTELAGGQLSCSGGTIIPWCNSNLDLVYQGFTHNISDITDLQAGDVCIMGYSSQEGGSIATHTQIFAGYDSDGKGIWYNCGSTKAIQREEGTEKYNSYNYNGQGILYVYRVPSE